QEQAAKIVGDKKALELKLNRLLKDQQYLQEKTKTALQVADQAQAEGNAERAAKYTSSAEICASQLVAVENQINETKVMYEQAVVAADQAMSQAKKSQADYHQQMSSIDQLRGQARQVKMQETAARANDQIGAIDRDPSVPTLDQVRDKIERRYADALGAQELTQNAVTSQMSEITSSGTDMKANARLAEIRAAMQEENKQEAIASEPAEKPAETPQETPAEEPVEEKPAEKPAETPQETPAEEPVEKPAEKPEEKPAATPADAPEKK
ncbi:MAG: PspA/IM30 family protein, partial [Mixta calida]|nr:PspA/IM30 family protein [Mixta calida]